MKNLLFLCVLAIAAGCSPSQESIQKAVEKGDYQYVEDYISNPKYWNDPTKSAINEVAIEALILLNRIDTAAKLYVNNKNKPWAEKIILKAIVNGLTKSKQQKMPVKLMEVIDDNRNDASDALLRRTAIEIEPALSFTKIKLYAEQTIDKRKNSDMNASLGFLRKAVLWDTKNAFSEPLKLMTSQVSDLKGLYDSFDRKQIEDELASKKTYLTDKRTDEVSGLKALEDDVRRNQKDLNDLHSGTYNVFVIGCLQTARDIAFLSDGRKTPFSACREIFQEDLKESKDKLNGFKKELRDIEIEIKNLEKAIPDHEAKIKAIIPKVEAAEFRLMEQLNAAVSDH